MLGQKLVFGFHGKTLPEEFKNLLREYKIGNVILFLRNVESAEQLRALCAEIQSLVQEETGYPAFIIFRSLSAARPGATPLSPSTRRAAW